MPDYNNFSGQSNITAYQIGEDRILVQFRNGEIYTYTYDSAGVDNVEEMKRLAQSGGGLNAFITQTVKYDYE